MDFWDFCVGWDLCHENVYGGDYANAKLLNHDTHFQWICLIIRITLQLRIYIRASTIQSNVIQSRWNPDISPWNCHKNLVLMRCKSLGHIIVLNEKWGIYVVWKKNHSLLISLIRLNLIFFNFLTRQVGVVDLLPLCKFY